MHLLNGWMCTFNQHPKLLTQMIAQMTKSILLIAKWVYNSCDLLVDQKLQSYLNTLEAKTQVTVRALICNPITVDAVMQLLTVLLWMSFLMNIDKLS